MHDCQKFREDWLDGTGIGPVECGECRLFCEETDAILIASVVAVPPISELPEAYWDGFEERLRARLIQENASRTSRVHWKWSALAAGAVIAAVLTWGMDRPEQQQVEPQMRFVNNHIRGLDPMVVAYLEKSELFLRNFTKIEPSYKDDLEDSRSEAKQSLMEIGEQKELADNFAPVRITLDEYENVLREIKNLDSSAELADLQTRIRTNGLIANMKAYQPQVMLASGR